MIARRVGMLAALVAALGIGLGAQAQEDRGRARVQGKVVGADGKPLQDVLIAVVRPGAGKAAQQAKTNNKGEFRVDNLGAGKWMFVFGGKEGLEEKSIDVEVGESGTTNVPDVTLGKPVDPNAALQEDIQKAAEMIQTKQVGEARKIYESILEKYPNAQPAFQAQVHGAIAQTYAIENDAPHAIEHFKKGVETDPSNPDLQLAYGEFLIQAGQKAEGEKILLGVDMASVKDPFAFINIAIGMINEGRSEDALALINKLMTQFPNETSLYYYRGRAYLAAKKLPEARADIEKFVASAPPTARELPDAKKVLEQLKDAK